MSSSNNPLHILENILKTKVELLCNGIIISKKKIDKSLLSLDLFQMGRRSGAGPAGGRYFRFSNGSIVLVPIWNEENENSNIVFRGLAKSQEILCEIKPNFGFTPSPFFLIDIPKFYSDTSSEGIEFRKIALIHGNKTLATTIHQKCKYWRSNQQCKFCGIEFSLKTNSTIEKKSGQQIVEAINRAKIENSGYAQHLTLTIGTQENSDKGMEYYYKTIKIIKEAYPEIPIHIQIEPMKDMNWYQKLKGVGVDSIGIHLEILDNEIRKRICPGKSHISKDTYYKHWKHALTIFGENQVSTFIIIGFEKNISKIKSELKKIIDIGVIPLITPVKYIEGVNIEIPKIDSNFFFEIVHFAAEICKINRVDPNKNKAGCIRCGGCSPIIEAFDLTMMKK